MHGTVQEKQDGHKGSKGPNISTPNRHTSQSQSILLAGPFFNDQTCKCPEKYTFPIQRKEIL